MFLQYPDKKTKNKILTETNKLSLVSKFGDGKNKLIKGDNLRILKTLLEDFNLKGKVDLIYIDPPFATNNHFTIGESRTSTISNCRTDKTAYKDELLGSDFLEFLRERLILLKELLSENGSIYLHIDYKIGHYVKIIMDEVFGIENFRNDITRIKCNPKNFKRKAYGNIKDLILFYSKSKDPIWNNPKENFTKEDVEKLFKKIDKNGRKYTTIPLHAPGETRDGPTGWEWKGQKPPKGRHWRSNPKILEEWDKQGLIEWSSNGVPRKKIFLDERNGKKKQDIWEYKDYQYPTYPTEKNIDLLKNIILASSNPDDLVLDCFCGSGTTLQAAQELGRNWIGIDQSEEAIKITQERLKNIPSSLFIGSVDYEFLEEQKHIFQETFLKTKSLSIPRIAEVREPVFGKNLVST
ncbi:site-specific DNA-methyltransferase [Candidatus Gracilibacteria bacterium]|nr:site-specific DNA-methyltransferase [Candidatus Gracilibacteria bacterium]MCF7856537.1 site-specific DNA-methyltransferase [Candidatus Gracilibacteria bacterium]MCF7896860.1 site-specific DNA-methyltransferase [Candidatus Gracilibacteria bacterium]